MAAFIDLSVYLTGTIEWLSPTPSSGPNGTLFKKKYEWLSMKKDKLFLIQSIFPRSEGTKETGPSQQTATSLTCKIIF